ncbi:Out at first protein [Gryllus bimaculatus]|nr:Out at first protein [Gryllus bimaculatus]
MTCGRDSSCACYVGFFYFLYFINIGNTQLLINVKNQGGDVLQETIAANVSEDAVTLEFQRSDGTLVTQLVDFRNDVQILKALVLGEEERGQSQYQVMCFVCHFRKGDFISSDAMSKLRQKNPGTVRTAEEDRGRDNFTMELLLDVGRSALVSRHAARRPPPKLRSRRRPRCRRRRTCGRVRVPSGAVHRVVPVRTSSNARARGTRRPRRRQLPLRHQDVKKCSLFAYYVRQNSLCLWDE